MLVAATDEQQDGGDQHGHEGQPKAHRECRSVADDADQFGRRRVAKRMDQEYLDGDGRGADRCGNRVDDRGIERSHAEEDKKHGDRERRQHRGPRAEEAQHSRRNGKPSRPS